MKIIICSSKEELGRQSAEEGATILRQVLAEQGQASIIVATGASQFDTLAALVAQPDIDWTRVTGFHLDEYLGLPMTHPASFRGYLKERFVDQVPIKDFHYVNGEGLDGSGDVPAECERLSKLIRAQPIDVAFVGIGENGHLAFNDPPADFETEEPYLIVELDEDCRRQQLGEGWFDSLDAVPREAISMSIRQIMKSRHIICSVPDERKAQAVRDVVEGPVTNQVPASILQEHSNARLYLDPPSASLLENRS
ncbi:glucosamine-6-phosphate deaminase [Bythopirellula polymerisocia]|uniref:Glucosamine-6-phosphate deaminase 1 n=1 Tax=Bythopirellula polymerisocia TaxID=2528003 RepID=A0A5C6D5D2_9BACT|nr:glucosamine-6-phosphate deaminase [Bythopirellula polymerisocia]TWU30109.1 Glucosamine-6-phosphate deaminase 1 [Bythopirellula polymerisocia]